MSRNRSSATNNSNVVPDNNFSRLDGLREYDSNTISSINGWDGNQTSSIVARPPSNRKGSVSSQVVSFMRNRKRPVTISEIVNNVASKRGSYSNLDSATRTISKEVMRLANWNFVNVVGSRNNGRRGRAATTFTLNSDLKRRSN